MTTRTRKLINPIKRKCRCGAKVTNHHFLCDKCWGITAKKKSQQKRKKLLDKAYAARDRKFKEKDNK